MLEISRSIDDIRRMYKLHILDSIENIQVISVVKPRTGCALIRLVLMIIDAIKVAFISAYSYKVLTFPE